MHVAEFGVVLMLFLIGLELKPALLWQAFAGHWGDFLAFVGFGGLALLAAITYTVGRRPYGYRGLGDRNNFV